MFRLLDIVRLKNEDTRFGIKPSFIGAIIDVHGGGAAYTVEFINENGETIEDALMVEYPEDDLELVKRA